MSFVATQNRRRFCTTALAASLFPRTQGLAQATAVDAPLSIAQWGNTHSHAEGKMSAMRSMPQHWAVQGYCPTDDAATKLTCYKDLKILTPEELLSLPGLQAVAVETSMDDACKTALQCLERGKHVHLDKPGSLDHASYKQMRLLAEEKKLILQMGYMLRYNPAFQLLMQAVNEGWLGDITEVDTSMGKLADAKLQHDLKRIPGGGMFELAGHVVDVVIKLLGRPTSISSFSTPVKDEILETQLAVFVYPQASVTIRCNSLDPFGNPKRHFSVTGTKGSFRVNPIESGKLVLQLSKPCGPYSSGTQAINLPVGKGRYDGEFKHLAQVLRGQTSFDWTAAHDILVHESLMKASGLNP